MDSNLVYLINHIFLPPKLPQTDDRGYDTCDRLTRAVHDAVKSYSDHLPVVDKPLWDRAAKMMDALLDNTIAGIDRPKLGARLVNMEVEDAIVLDIRSQNAGVIIRRLPQEYSFEAFELSPTTKEVMAAQGRLIRCFPGPVIAVHQDRLLDPTCRRAIIKCISKLDIEVIEEACPHTRKAGNEVAEIRDSRDPMFVTEMLMGILRGIGSTLDVMRIYKHTRDDVLWDNCMQPWRRSARWLLLRVALQSHLMEQQSHGRYKYFMIYFMARILESALKIDIPSDLLFVMLAKINRRILKLGDAADKLPCLEFVQRNVTSAEHLLQTRWKAIEQCAGPSQAHRALLEQLGDLDFTTDTALSLAELGPYMHRIAERRDLESTRPHSSKFSCNKRVPRTATHIPNITTFNGKRYDLRLMLSDVEWWVQEHLDTWLASHNYGTTPCLELAETLNCYISDAVRLYGDDSENFSIMVLTFMDMWVAFDKLSTELEPLLLRYSTDLPLSVFDPLLLPKKQQMERLSKIEQYIANRNREASAGYPSIFEEVTTNASFAVMYYEQSNKHKNLKADIEANATQDRENKKAELVAAKHEWKLLTDRANGMQCESRLMERSRNSQRDVMTHIPASCDRCILRKRAETMKIDIHEWPLPQDDLRAKATVFELNVPIIISKWRDTTYRILVDVLSPAVHDLKKPKTYPLFKYIGIQPFIKAPAGRLQMVSLTKEFSRAHYKPQNINIATEETICVNNGLQCELFDTKHGHFTKKFLGGCNIRPNCTFHIDCGHYETLQPYLVNTTHTSNDVLAAQSHCPEGLTQHEFYSFATLRAGHRLQWRNIARALVDRILNFSHDATNLLILQAIWQAGKSTADHLACRDSHMDIEEREFGLSLLCALTSVLSNVESNWQGAPAVRTFVALAARILSVSGYEDVREQAFRFLEKARTVTIGWAREVALLHRSQNDKELEQLANRCLDLALTCHATFDVDSNDLGHILSSIDNVATVVECTVMIHDRSPMKMGGLPPRTKAMLYRSFRVSHRVESLLRSSLITNSAGIELAMGRVWNGYSSNGKLWTALEGSSERWVTTTTSETNGCLSMDVHFNLLDGKLLVNGIPLSRLSEDYETHPTYRRLFGDKILEVVPSSMKGMVFESRYRIHDKQVHFALYDDGFIIRAQLADQVHELIPHHILQSDFPYELVENYCHWLDVSTGCVEWRPLDAPWDTPTLKWQLSLNAERDYYLTQDFTKLVDYKSHTVQTVSAILRPIEDAKHIQVALNTNLALIEVRLPRFNLDFTLREGDTSLESKQFRGMVIDENQTIGTLTGLQSKLVLRDAAGSSRLVITPDGPVYFNVEGNHSWAMIDTGADKHVMYYQYQIDTQLGRLVDNGSLLSRLYKLYLHALTSHCIPDTLTGRTGTEEALQGLSMASTNSFLKLRKKERDLLELISELTPARIYYPKHLKVMQTTKWTKLSAISQHEGFERAVSSILQTAKSLETFKDPADRSEVVDVEPSDRGDSHLQFRSAIRNAYFRVDGFGAEGFTVDQDLRYMARDCANGGKREQQVCQISRLTQEWSPNPKISARGSKLLEHLKSWKTPLTGAQSGMVSFGFEKEWLKPLRDFLPRYWCSLHADLSASDSSSDKYSIMVFLATLAYSKHSDMFIVQALLALATVPQLRSIAIPPHVIFELKAGYAPVRHELLTAVDQTVTAFEHTGESRLPQNPGESAKAARARRQTQYQSIKNGLVSVIVEHLMRQWPIVNVAIPENSNATYINKKITNAKVQSMFLRWSHNNDFLNYSTQVQQVLDLSSEYADPTAPYKVVLPRISYQPKQSHVVWKDLFIKNPAPVFVEKNPSHDLASIVRNSPRHRNDHKNLNALLAKLSSLHAGDYEASYIHDLRRSAEALSTDLVADLSVPQHVGHILQENLDHWKDAAETAYRCISTNLRPSGSPLFQPRLSPAIALSSLAHYGPVKLTAEWKHALIHFGVALTTLQHAERLVACGRNHAELLNELMNPGHVDWDPFQYPDWLILEVENGILIRQEQAQIAKQMISPSSGTNSIMQLNMGKGKSSVIVPIVAAKLADGSKLARVVVLKSLSTQMFQLLINKLGGMLNRRIFVLPISRSLKFGDGEVKQIQEIYERCRSTGGIVLIQPEHLLSFELLGLDYLLSNEQNRQGAGQAMVKTQRWLLENSRDILDESDELLSVRFELIYTMGLQQSIQFSPDRWLIVQHVLTIMRQFLLQTDIKGLEILPTAGSCGFPRTRFLELEAGGSLMSHIAHCICDQGLPGVPLWNLPPQVRATLLRFILDPTMSPAEAAPLQGQLYGSDVIIYALLLLRGLLAGGILNFAFAQKRWRVNYGLDLSRTKLAVPYNAKDSPTARSEFSHPDTAILLTCLSYYYGGLEETQIFASFEELLQSDHAQEEYAEWIRDVENLPIAFKLLSGVNLSNVSQCRRELFPLLKFSKGLIDFYTSHVVFPKEMKEFPHKLSSSGWDIGRDKGLPTTGFSGTNDSRYILPIAVKQCDLPQQLSTNAEVLDCLLRAENTLDVKFTSSVEILDAGVLFTMAIKSSPPARVILDVGAQILELRNEEVARKWLGLVPASDALAAIYFDDRNELCVISRSGVKEFLQVSPFAKKMDQCLVYLDEAHTRGTDLKMPSNYRAIVTLGPDLTKDRLAQACMRMRKLGKGQSVLFCAPLEVQTKILHSSGKTLFNQVEVADVLSWCIQNTWSNTRKSIPLWATQGLRHYRRREACGTPSGLPDNPRVILEEESQSLQQRYGYEGSQSSEQQRILFQSDTDNIKDCPELAAIRQKCQEFGLGRFNDASLHEEQERELQPENEREQQIERPASAPACVHKVHPSLKHLVKGAYLDRFSPAYEPAFSSLENTSASKCYEMQGWPQDLLVTNDFVNTVQVTGNETMDDFLRPVHWIISIKYGNGTSCVVISPFEANELIPVIRKHAKVRLHIYAPRLSSSHRSLDDLSYCSIPPVGKFWSPPKLSTQINLFAGQLYLRDYDEYLYICRLLGLSYHAPDERIRVHYDGFIQPDNRLMYDALMANCRFKDSPVDFLRVLTSLRRKGQSFATSHMGRLLRGDLLKPEAFEDLGVTDDVQNIVREFEEDDRGEPMVIDLTEDVIIDLTGD